MLCTSPSEILNLNLTLALGVCSVSLGFSKSTHFLCPAWEFWELNLYVSQVLHCHKRFPTKKFSKPVYLSPISVHKPLNSFKKKKVIRKFRQIPSYSQRKLTHKFCKERIQNNHPQLYITTDSHIIIQTRKP